MTNYQKPKYRSDRVIISSSIPRVDADRLQELADRRAAELGKSFMGVSAIVREIIAEYLEKESGL